MKTARLFRTIWRANGVLLLLALLLLVGLGLAAAGSSLVWSRQEARTPPAVVAATGEKLFFAQVEDVAGSPFVILPLESRRPSVGMSSGKSHVSETRNLLFYDAASGSAHWLRPDHRALISRYELIRASGVVQARWDARAAPADPVRWIRYELALADTNHDGVTDQEDARAVAVSGPDGAGLTIVIEDINEVLGYATPRDGKLVVFFRHGEQELAGEVDLVARKLVRSTPLPKS